jgi:hypothetical protein
MIDILTQKFNYASIIPYKNYCRLSDRKKLQKNFNDNLDLLSEEDEDVFTIKNYAHETNNKSTGKIFTLPTKKKKKQNYFYAENDIQERFGLEYLYFNPRYPQNEFDTTKETQLKRHYGNPFSEIRIVTIERSIRLHGDKLTIKLYLQYKTRSFNCIYFRKRFDVQSITINLKTGNFTITNITKTGKTNSRVFRTNSFRMLKQLIVGKSFLNPKNIVRKNSRIYSEFEKIFNDIDFTTTIQSALGIKNGFINYSNNPNEFLSDILKKFVELKNIKTPNGNIENWLTNFYPTEKYLKKNDRKLIASILDMFNVKTKYTIKILHEYPNVDLMGLVRFCGYFGSDFSKYIGNLNPVVFENGYSNKNLNQNDLENNKFNLLQIQPRYFLKDIEKENLIKIANSNNYKSDSVISQRFSQLLDDHFRMIETIREYDPEIYMKAKTKTEFDEEHTELSKIISALNKGWVIEYKFNEKMVEDIEKPIPLKVNLGTEDKPIYGDDLGVSFYPKILKREEDYVEEGTYMHHCVASYADKDKSIIISVRTEDDTDRVTCEFNCQNGALIQARHFCNRTPPADIEHVILNDLSKKVKKYASLGLLHASEKMKVPIKINGIEVKKKEPTLYGGDLFYHLANNNYEF